MSNENQVTFVCLNVEGIFLTLLQTLRIRQLITTRRLAENVADLPASLTWTADYTFGTGIAAGGFATVTLFSNGNVTFKGHFHDSGAGAYNVSVV